MMTAKPSTDALGIPPPGEATARGRGWVTDVEAAEALHAAESHTSLDALSGCEVPATIVGGAGAPRG